MEQVQSIKEQRINEITEKVIEVNEKFERAQDEWRKATRRDKLQNIAETGMTIGFLSLAALGVGMAFVTLPEAVISAVAPTAAVIGITSSVVKGFTKISDGIKERKLKKKIFKQYINKREKFSDAEEVAKAVVTRLFYESNRLVEIKDQIENNEFTEKELENLTYDKIYDLVHKEALDCQGEELKTLIKEVQVYEENKKHVIDENCGAYQEILEEQKLENAKAETPGLEA